MLNIDSTTFSRLWEARGALLHESRDCLMELSRKAGMSTSEKKLTTEMDRKRLAEVEKTDIVTLGTLSLLLCLGIIALLASGISSMPKNYEFSIPATLALAAVAGMATTIPILTKHLLQRQEEARTVAISQQIPDIMEYYLGFDVQGNRIEIR